MKNFIFRLLFLTLVIIYTTDANASHVLGGEITWESQGNGSYIFELVVYRDCNGFDISTGNESIAVWGHPTVNAIPVSFVSRQDLSPMCTEVNGGPTPFSCGTGSNGGNGSGAFEKGIYRSAPITLSGSPPSVGWIFTFSSFSRSQNLTNITNPETIGITIVAKMFNTGSTTNYDSSPKFLEDPFIVVCAGQPYIYNQNGYDPNLDSMVYSWGTPLAQINTAFNPPADPPLIVFEPGFSYTSPTPSPAMNPLNIPATINSQNGELSFTSFTTGNFSIKLVVHSYRNGVLMSEIQREIQVIVENCPVVNLAPELIASPFPANSYETTVLAGELVDFNLIAEDFDLLQDGTAQTVSITASGSQFGANLTSTTTGCDNPPCAILTNPLPISGLQTAQADFRWQTACNHLMGPTGIIQDLVQYTFTFRLKDDMCQIPAVRYVTVTVNVRNSNALPATELECVQVQPNGNVLIQWEPLTDPDNDFNSFEVHTLQSGLIATVTNPTQTSYLHNGANANVSPQSYFLVTTSGCGGIVRESSDTLSSIHLTLNNPGDGTAILQWTAPSIPLHSDWNDYYYIRQEYPTGTWTIIDSVAVSTTSYIDTIVICDAFLNYQIELPTTTCSFLSNIIGDNFTDQIGPFIPEIQSVSIDTITGNLTINWNVNQATDTYGYIIYSQDENGFFTDLDTLWGINSTTYTISAFDLTEPLSYSVAAFDDCFTPQTPPTYQTSGKADIHTIHFLSGSLNICEQKVILNWTAYQGWDESIDYYRVYGYKTNGQWELLHTTTENTAEIQVDTETTYCISVQAVSTLVKTAFSNIVCIPITSPSAPELHYLSNTTVVDNSYILIKHLTSLSPNVGALILERWNEKENEFEEVTTRLVTNQLEEFIDEESDPNEQSYTYRIVAIDSCGRPSIQSNIGTSIFLETFVDNSNMTVTLQWNAYKNWKAPVTQYFLHRGIDGNIDPLPLATISPERRTYVDDLTEFFHTSGKVCYYIVAIEGTNVLGFNEVSVSNVSCAIFEPVIFIPSAFTVGGINPQFMPVVNLFDLTSYDFTIFDRWGQTVFRTNDRYRGWQGHTPSRQIAKEGVYLYVVRLKDSEGNEITRRGHVTLLDARE